MVAWPFFEVARELELPVDAGLSLLGWSSAGPGANVRIPHDLANDVLSWAVLLSGRPDFGLLAAERVEPGHFDLVELASRSQSTMGEALATLSSLLPLAHDGLAMRVERGPASSRLTVSLRSGLALHPAGHDFIAGSLLIAARRQRGRDDISLERIAFPYPRPADPGYLEAFFAMPLAFDADALTIDFPTAALAFPLLRANADLGRVLRATAEGLLTPSRGPVETRVRALVAERLAQDGSELGAVAHALHMSERTLRRRLEVEGVGFRELVDEVRRECALALVADPARSTEEVAAALGFTTAQALHRAFRRWTGGTLQAHRARLRGAR